MWNQGDVFISPRNLISSVTFSVTGPSATLSNAGTIATYAI
jgi:hypothetical protein